MLDERKSMDDDVLLKMNLLMLIQNITNTSLLDRDKLREVADQVIDKVVTQMKVPENSTFVFGDSMYSGQIYTSDTNSISKDNAIMNNLPIYNVTQCENLLKEYYNISKIIYMTNSVDGSLTGDSSNSYRITAYDDLSRKKLNLDLCENVQNEIKIPLTNTDINMTRYTELKEQGIDILNKNDPVFTDRCATFVDSNGKDTSINWRIENLYQKKMPMCIGFNCTYDGIDEFYYAKCTCTGLQTDVAILNEFVDFFLSKLSELNIGILFCYKNILKVYYCVYIVKPGN
jgi:hypothetical protein